MSCTRTACSPLVKIVQPTPVWVDWPWPEWLYAISRRWRRMRTRRQQRQKLLELDDHLLADIGVSREQALREAGKRFWQ